MCFYVMLLQRNKQWMDGLLRLDVQALQLVL